MTGTTRVSTAEQVVLGLGSCLDYEIVWDAGVLQGLVDRYGITLAEAQRSVPVRTERDLVCSVLGFLREGAGGERFVESSEVVEAFAGRFDHRITLGGSNVRAAIALSRLGLACSLHLVSIDDHVRRLLPADVPYLCSASGDSTDPHLIVQFPAGAQVQVESVAVRAPRANRLIYVNDPPNREMVLSPELGRMLERAQVFLISGFNTVQDPATLRARLAELREHVRHLPPGAVVVFEDAGYHVPGMSEIVRQSLVDVIDIYGLNEDELQDLIGHPVDLLDAAELQQALAELRRRIRAGTIVVHSQYWCLALGQDSERYRAALESATAMAATRYLHGDAFTAQDFDRVGVNPRHPGGVAVVRALEAALPGEVCGVAAFCPQTSTPTMVGLGDAFVGGFIAGLITARRAR